MFWAEKGGISDMISEMLGEIFEGDFEDTCGEQISLMSMGGQADGLAFSIRVGITILTTSCF